MTRLYESLNTSIDNTKDNIICNIIWSNIIIVFIIFFVWIPCFLITCSWCRFGNPIHPVMKTPNEQNDIPLEQPNP